MSSLSYRKFNQMNRIVLIWFWWKILWWTICSFSHLVLSFFVIFTFIYLFILYFCWTFPNHVDLCQIIKKRGMKRLCLPHLIKMYDVQNDIRNIVFNQRYNCVWFSLSEHQQQGKHTLKNPTAWTMFIRCYTIIKERLIWFLYSVFV